MKIRVNTRIRKERQKPQPERQAPEDISIWRRCLRIILEDIRGLLYRTKAKQQQEVYDRFCELAKGKR